VFTSFLDAQTHTDGHTRKHYISGPIITRLHFNGISDPNLL